ncbi:DUF1127 domain-containing protein [Silicimonas algicola]|uniref:Uncharacterized protein DUF1127 n=1 Tax=Silicimonas algicola TaxID=1826607 RepID=A0A316GCL7_9RHOB|nr:DUF1127 domain-containing protein [Silicimonas algicola]AZQ66302.1 DUF1127 domain-containing protein [Silicimonas algicola]PWK58624.1 uncharacterized protein DUF1127 [Silicimonas algicola]
MSTVNVNHDARDLATGLPGIIGGMRRRYAQYRTYRTTLDELQSLTDRELSDLGLHRSALRGVAYKAAYEG